MKEGRRGTLAALLSGVGTLQACKIFKSIFEYKQHNDSNQIINDIAGDYLSIEPLKDGRNTFDENPPPADAAEKLAARDKWVADINFQPDKKIMIHGAIYTLQPGNFVDANRKGYARTKNSDGALENFWAEKYSVIAGGTGDSGLPYWDDTIIGHRDPRVLPLPDGPKSIVGYNGKVVSKERLLIEMTHGLGNLTKLSKENNLHTIIHATRQLA